MIDLLIVCITMFGVGWLCLWASIRITQWGSAQGDARMAHKERMNEARAELGRATLKYEEEVDSEQRVKLEALRQGFWTACLVTNVHNDLVAHTVMRIHHDSLNTMIVELGGEATPLPPYHEEVDGTNPTNPS